MAARATWKGSIRLGEVVVPVALYAAATTSKRVSFHIINRETGHRVHREYVDEETGKAVDREHQAKGYEVGPDEYVVLDPEEIAEAVPESDKTLRIEAFIACPEVDTVYFDKPYFVAPADENFTDSFAVLREGMRKKKVAALARAVLFRRVRSLMLRVQGQGLIAHTLNFDYEVRSSDEVFGDLPAMKIQDEMLDLARHIIKTKSGKFDPREFDDRYDQAVAELVKAKIEGREIPAPKPREEPKVTSLIEALRESAKMSGKSKPSPPSRKKAAASSRSGRSTAARQRKAG